MRELDHNGLLLCEYQAKLFEKSLDFRMFYSNFYEKIYEINIGKRIR